MTRTHKLSVITQFEQPSKRKCQVGDLAWSKGHLMTVLDYWPRYRKQKSWHSYYALSDGRYVRHDAIRPFKGPQINMSGKVLKPGDVREGILLHTPGRWRLIRWRGRIPKYPSHPEIYATVMRLRAEQRLSE